METPQKHIPKVEKSKKRRSTVASPDGRWVTDPPFTLPPSCNKCPCPSCPARHRLFRPYWRLNEHMKRRHGWPRKQTQPNLDQRIGNKFANVVRTRRLESQSSDEEEESEDEDDSSSKSSPAIKPTQQGSSTSISSTSDIKMSPDDVNLNNLPTMGIDIDKSQSCVRQHITTSRPWSDDTFTYHPNSQLTARSSSASSSSSMRDEVMSAEMESYVLELEQEIAREEASSTSDSRLLRNRKDMLTGFRQLIHSGNVRVNTIITVKESRSIEPWYHALARRSNLGTCAPRSPPRLAMGPLARITSKTTTKTISKTVSNKISLVPKKTPIAFMPVLMAPSLGEGGSSTLSAISPPKSDLTLHSTPKPKFKLVLKLGSKQNGTTILKTA